MESQFQELHFPSAEQVKMLGHADWTTNVKPNWLGFIHDNKPYKLEDIAPQNMIFIFGKTKKIINPYLERAFQLKKSQTDFSTRLVYHGTKEGNVNSIAENNFNWRLAGTSRGVKHGRGVSFSEDVSFADQFCGIIPKNKRMIAVKILHSKSCVGEVGDTLPKHGYDTTHSPNGNVLVKFEDSEFLPLYVVTLHPEVNHF